MNTYHGNSGHLSKRVPERIYYSIWALLGDLWRESKEAKVCSRLEVIRKWEQFYGWEKQLSFYGSGEEDVCMLWVHNNLVCVCGRCVFCTTVPIYKVWFSFSKEYFNCIRLWTDLQIKNELIFAALLLCQIKFSSIVIHITKHRFLNKMIYFPIL